MARFDVSTLVEEVLGEAIGHTLDVDQVSWLDEPLTDSGLSATINTTGTRISRGIIEIGDELIFVSSVNQDSGVAMIAPFGRGYQGTTPAAHAAGAKVTMMPRFPRARLLDSLNDVIRGVYPFIFGVGTTTLETSGGGRIGYELPADAEGVLRVEVDTSDPTNDWEELDRWSFNRSADTTAFPSGKSLDILELQVPGRNLQVLYIKRPEGLELGDEFTDCGLRESAWPAIKFGTLHMLATGGVSGLAGPESVHAATKNRQHRADPSGVQREYFTLHRQYLLDERNRLLQDYPATNNMER